MSKLPVALIAALIAVATLYSSTAEAGLRIGIGFGFGGPSFAHGNGGGYKKHYHRKRYIARRVKKEKVYVAKRKVSEPKVAKVEKVAKPEVVATAPVVEADVIAENENSSITTAALDSTAAVDPETVTPVEVKAETKTVEAKPAVSKPEKAAKLDCKKFFPSVGMTLSVPCE
jgi:hypothetical protein